MSPSLNGMVRPLATLLCAAGFAALSAAPASAVPVDLELVIATDASGSIDDNEANLQREGVAAAFKSDELAKVIGFGIYGKIAVAYLDWSNEFDNTVVVDWTLLTSKNDAIKFADALLAAPRSYGRRTSISSAVVSSMELLEKNNYEGTRRTIDISGDGPNNFGLSLAPVREEAINKGITINGLPIVLGDDNGFGYRRGGFFADIDKYYANCVIGGRGAFAIVAKGYNDFSRAVRRKLILEISAIEPETQFAAAPAARDTLLVPVQVRELPPPPGYLRPPAQRETNCDTGFGGFGGGGFR
jgi:hypothetical protein